MRENPEPAPRASVIILTRNGMPLVERCFQAVLEQVTPWPFEVVVIDSGSTDGTWELAKSLPFERIRIPPRTFNHGDTRNLGASRARGQFLVFVVQDAIPADNRWLVNLVSACERPGVAGSFSRQLVRPESDPITRYLCMGTTPCDLKCETKALPRGRRLSDLSPVDRFRLAAFQNVSSCVRQTAWREHPFARVPYGEDIEWGKRMIEVGYSIVYEPSSVVYHSHDRSALYALKRAYADHYQVTELFDYVLVPTSWRLLRGAISGTLDSWRYVVRSEYSLGAKLRFVLLAPAYVVSRALGFYLGAYVCRRSPRPRWVIRLDRALRNGV